MTSTNSDRALSAQVNLVHITISHAILSIVTRSHQPQQLLPGPALSNALGTAIYPDRHKQGYLDWKYNMIYSLDMHERVDSITDLVYERLLTRRPGLLLADHGRVYTLSDNVSSPTLDTIPDRHTLPSSGHSDEVPGLDQQHVQLAHERTIPCNKEV